jgi:type VI secretion system protein ImpG
MFNAYYERELTHLRSLAAEFAARNPALAPLLSGGVAPDPDVERLLEGTAFLTGLVHQRLDDEFPEFIQELAHLLFPQYLRPMPCMSVLKFTPKVPLAETVQIPAGVEVASVPIDDVRAIFRTVFPVSVEPVTLHSVRWDRDDVARQSLLLELSFDGEDVNAWRADRLRFYLADGFSEATRLLLLLSRHVREIRVGAPDGPVTVLPPSAVELAGLRPDLPLLPNEDNVQPAYNLLREYFAFHDKFLFVDVRGLDRWRERGRSGRFTLRFMFDALPAWAPEVHLASLALNATPVVNMFEDDAHPISLDHRQAEYHIRLSRQPGRQGEQIYRVKSVTAHAAKTGEVPYQPFGAFEADRRLYHVRIAPSVLGEGYDHYVGIPYARGEVPDITPQTLSLRLTCTQGKLPEGLRLGDISQNADTTPARMSFGNIRGVTSYRQPLMGERLLWRMLSLLSANHARLANRDQLCSLLTLHLPEGCPTQGDQALVQRINAIEKFESHHERRFLRGSAVEGNHLELTCRGDQFVNLGDLFLFGAVLDEFFAGITSLNTFSALTLRDSVSGEILQWPPKIGRQRLL